jgi:hypothetical protein
MRLVIRFHTHIHAHTHAYTHIHTCARARTHTKCVHSTLYTHQIKVEGAHPVVCTLNILIFPHRPPPGEKFHLHTKATPVDEIDFNNHLSFNTLSIYSHTAHHTGSRLAKHYLLHIVYLNGFQLFVKT